jgi:hypothetical protein
VNHRDNFDISHEYDVAYFQQIKVQTAVPKYKVLVVRDFADGLLLGFSFDTSIYCRIAGFSVSCYLWW